MLFENRQDAVRQLAARLEPFLAVSQSFRDFSQVRDVEVMALLAAHRARLAGAVPALGR